MLAILLLVDKVIVTFFNIRYYCFSGGIQPLRLGPQCDTRKIVLHELMHALGFLHEHSEFPLYPQNNFLARPDRDKYIKINWNLIDPHYKGKTRNDFLN